MSSLKEQLGGSEKRQQVVADACEVLDQEVADKSGISGIAIKTAYGVVKNVKSGFIAEVVDNLLDDFLDALQPVYDDAQAAGVSAKEHFETHAGRAADALLSITDSRAEKAQRAVIKKTYDKLRPTAKKHVTAAMPRVGGLLAKHLP